MDGYTTGGREIEGLDINENQQYTHEDRNSQARWERSYEEELLQQHYHHNLKYYEGAL